MIHTIIPITITPKISEDMAGDILRLRRAFFFATGCPAIFPPPPGVRKHRFKALIETIVECKKVFFNLQIPRRSCGLHCRKQAQTLSGSRLVKNKHDGGKPCADTKPYCCQIYQFLPRLLQSSPPRSSLLLQILLSSMRSGLIRVGRRRTEIQNGEG